MNGLDVRLLTKVFAAGGPDKYLSSVYDSKAGCF